MLTSLSKAAFSLAFTALCLSPLKAEPHALDSKIEQAFKAGELKGLHSVMVIHKGTILAETYFTGKDQRWGRDLGERQHRADTLHDLRSVTKSIVSLLYGIALSEGKVPPLKANLLAQFPQYADLQKENIRNTMQVGHALTMKMGTKWNEDLPYTDPANSEIAMEYAKDRYRFVLDRPMVKEPGTYWVYNGGAVALIAKLIADGTGVTLDDYANEKLFKPLGITKYEWVRGSDNIPSAASGLRLRLPDMAKIGTMIANGGTFKGQRIVSKAWLQASFTPHSQLRTGLRYGYFWWLAPEKAKPGWVAGFGNGGQRLMVFPEKDLILAVFAGRYNDFSSWKLSAHIFRNIIAPYLKAEAR